MSPRLRFSFLVPVLVALLACADRSETDAALQQALAEHRAQFDSLRDLALADTALSAVATSTYATPQTPLGRHEVAPSSALPQARWDRYRVLLDTLQLRYGVRMDSSGVWFLRSATGIVGSGSLTGFAYRRPSAPPVQLCASLAHPPPGVAERHRDCYRTVGNGWYLYRIW